MYTILFIITTQELTTYQVKYCQSEAQAERKAEEARNATNEFRAITPVILKGYYSEEEAIAEYLD